MAFFPMKKKTIENFPIGYVYISTSNINPSTYFGGTWESIGAGRCLVGIDPNDTSFNTVKKTGGEKTHTLTVAEMPSHSHNTVYQPNNASGSTHWGITTLQDMKGSTPTTSTGGGQAHNNLPPYLTVYMWERTA